MDTIMHYFNDSLACFRPWTARRACLASWCCFSNDTLLVAAFLSYFNEK